MARAEYDTQRASPDIIELLPAPRQAQAPDVQLPRPPATETRGEGLFGLGVNRQSQSSQRRRLEIHLLGEELAYAEAMALALELRGLKVIGDGMSLAERIVYAHPAETLAGMVAEDLAGELAARSRLRHARLMDLYDADAMDVIRRRR